MAKPLNERKKVILALMKDKDYIPMKEKELAIMLQLPKERREELTETLNELLAECKIECSKRGRYSIATTKTAKGVFTGNRNGYGFVTIEGRDDDIYIPEKETLHAMHGDEVKIILLATPRGKRQEGKVVEILKHNTTEIIGFFEKKNSFAFVLPDNQKFNEDIFIPSNLQMNAKHGDKVICKITFYGDEKKKPEGEIIEILGNVKDPGVDVMSIARAYGLIPEFPDEVMEEIEKSKFDITAKELEGREDFRDKLLITIDGEDAKDLDDAVSLEMDGENFILGVHIADVSHYVVEKTALNKEGYNRATSVYLADRVIPMLPKELSNGICSLNEGVDRLTLSCVMTLDPKGKIIEHRIVESVIKSAHRMTYTDVNAIITDHDEALCKKYSDIVPMLDNMAALSKIIRENRKKRGSIDFDFPETKVILDKKGHAVDIIAYERNAATDLIEDFMLAANETVAEEYFYREMPFLYRSHEKPDEDKMEQLATFLTNFGKNLKFKNGEVHPKEMQKLMASIEGEAYAGLIMRLALRSLKQARYTAENLGHYGLAAKFYCHFTSPIRRYPDLMVHRIIKECIHNKMNDKRIAHFANMMEEVGTHCSERERRADEVERETVKLKKVEYMEDHYGEIFKGVISGVTNYGFYVELENTVEGMVRVGDLTDDHYDYVEDKYMLVGERTGKMYVLGQEVTVIPASIDKLTRTIDFVLIEGQYGEV